MPDRMGAGLISEVNPYLVRPQALGFRLGPATRRSRVLRKRGIKAGMSGYRSPREFLFIRARDMARTNRAVTEGRREELLLDVSIIKASIGGIESVRRSRFSG